VPWPKVESYLRTVFAGSGVKITVYSLPRKSTQQAVASQAPTSPSPQRRKRNNTPTPKQQSTSPVSGTASPPKARSKPSGARRSIINLASPTSPSPSAHHTSPASSTITLTNSPSPTTTQRLSQQRPAPPSPSMSPSAALRQYGQYPDNSLVNGGDSDDDPEPLEGCSLLDQVESASQADTTSQVAATPDRQRRTSTAPMGAKGTGTAATVSATRQSARSRRPPFHLHQGEYLMK
jgi:hypothetical protein